MKLYDGDYKIHVYVCRQHEELKHPKQDLNENEVIFRVDFSENYEDKEKNVLQSVYFAYETLLLYTAAYYFRNEAKHYHDFGLSSGHIK